MTAAAKVRAIGESGSATRMYFQWARGRAIVVRHAMDSAREHQRAIAEIRSGREACRLRVVPVAYWFAPTGDVIDMLQDRIRRQVKRAREACREWRRYRREMADCQRLGI